MQMINVNEINILLDFCRGAFLGSRARAVCVNQITGMERLARNVSKTSWGMGGRMEQRATQIDGVKAKEGEGASLTP